MEIEQLNEKRIINKKDRHELILELLQENDVKKESEIQNYLFDKGIKISQPTIHRDLKDLGVIKNKFGILQLNTLDKRNQHLKELKSLLNSHRTAYSPNVKTIYIQTSSGTSQAIAFHLENIFKEIILKAIIDYDSITLLVDAESFHKNDEFQQILNAINEK